MKENIKKKLDSIKEYSGAIIACCSVILTIIYSVFCFFINVYHIGYFNSLNINLENIKIDYSGIFYKIISAFIFILIFLYLVLSFKESVTITKEKINNIWINKNGICNKILNIIEIAITSFCELLVIFLPVVICLILISNNINLTFGEIVKFAGVLYILFFIISIFKFNSINLNSKELGSKIFIIISIILLVIVSLFYFGKNKINNSTTMPIIQDQQYAITYNNDDYFILHKISIEDNILKIYKNKQKIIKIEDCEYEIMEFKDVVLLE